jgi:hypothetical protein
MLVCGFKFSCAQHLSCLLLAICEQHIKTCETKPEQVAATASTATDGSPMAATQRGTVPAAPTTRPGTSGIHIFVSHPPSADPQFSLRIQERISSEHGLHGFCNLLSPEETTPLLAGCRLTDILQELNICLPYTLRSSLDDSPVNYHISGEVDPGSVDGWLGNVGGN